MLTTFLLCLLSVIGFSQAVKPKTDTIYLIEVTDTVEKEYVFYDGGKNVVKFSRPGYFLFKGLKKFVNGQMQWVAEPKFIGVLDGNKKRVTPLPKIN